MRLENTQTKGNKMKTECCLTCNHKLECCLRIYKNNDKTKCDKNTQSELGLSVESNFVFDYNSDYETHI